MAREALDRKIKQIKDELLVEGSMVEQMTMQAVQALLDRDLESAQRIYDYDRRVNQKHIAIEKKCLTMMATEPPILATDLRLLASILEVNSILESFGDYAKGIARICMMIGMEPPLKRAVDITGLAEKVMDMLHQALGAFVGGDLEAANNIPCTRQHDLKIEANRTNETLLSLMIAEPRNIQRANKLLWVVHNIERMVDLVVNICERTIYIATGDLRPLKTAAGIKGQTPIPTSSTSD